MNFSVAMSVYKNDEVTYFERALESITTLQTVKPNEINLVVDGPIPSSLERVIKKYEVRINNFNVIRLEKNHGLGNALKLAVEASTYELIARMDSDDVSLPTRFEEQLYFFQNNPDTDIVGGDISEFIGDESNIIARRKVPCTDYEIKKYIKKRCPFNHMSVMYKKSSVQDAGGYQDWFWNEDYYLWIRMLKNNSVFGNTGTVLVNVRVSNAMYKRRGGVKYFKSEAKLQKFMYQNDVINFSTYIFNVIKRLIIQVLLPNNLRGWVFRTFARK